MSGAVRVGVVAFLGGILDVGHVDGDAAVPLLGGVVDGGVVAELGQLLLGQHLGDGRGQGRLAVIHVADGAWRTSSK